MTYKMVAIDLDDTLLNKEHQVSRRNKDVIQKLTKQGIKVIIATGRMYVSALPFTQKLGLKGPVITYNGAYIKDNGSGNILYHQPIKEEMARQILSFAEKENLHINLYQNDKLYVAERNENARLYEEIAGIEAIEVGSLLKFIKGDVTKLLIIIHDYEKKLYYLKKLQEEYPGLNITESKKIYIEFMAQDISKGKALKNLAGQLNFKKEEIVAIGDGWNDREMISWSGFGIAMGEAAEGVKEVADMVAPPHDEDGVAVALSKVFDL